MVSTPRRAVPLRFWTCQWFLLRRGSQQRRGDIGILPGPGWEPTKLEVTSTSSAVGANLEGRAGDIVVLVLAAGTACPHAHWEGIFGH